MDMRRKLLMVLGGALVSPVRLFAQQPPRKVHRIGFLGLASASSSASRPRVGAFQGALRDLGYVEGENIETEFRWAEWKYDRLPELARELVALKVDVLVTYGTSGARAAMLATATIPIVVAAAGDAVGTDLASSRARAGRNVTGSMVFSAELYSKRINLLKESFPRAKRAAVLLNQANPANGLTLHAVGLAAKPLQLELQRFEVRDPKELPSAFVAMSKSRIDALAIPEDAMLTANAEAIADLAAAHRLPSIGSTEFAEAGGLMGYGVNLVELYRRAAYFVGRILKGAKPGYIPIEHVTKFELVINRKTERTLGLSMPQSLLLRADDVIK